MRLLIVISFLFAAPRLAGAQFPAEVQPGTRVRVWIPETVRQEQEPVRRQLLRGTVESVDRGILRLEVPGTAGSLAIPRAAVRRLDVSRGVSPGESMIERAAGGAIGGAILLNGVEPEPTTSASVVSSVWPGHTNAGAASSTKRTELSWNRRAQTLPRAQ